jgi:uncharacterized protein (TIGR03643 family)
MLQMITMARKRIFSEAEVEEIIKLAWADTVPFDVITREFGLTENQTGKFMRTHQSEKTYIRWCERTAKRSGTSSKHRILTTKTSMRLKS